MKNGKQAKTVLNPGDVLQSRYRILQQLGHGGFSRTYLAEDINRFNECCVLKEFAPQLQLKDTFILEKAQELFEREAGVLYRLKHPQIPQFRQLFRHTQQDQEYLLLVEDYIEGSTYCDLFHRRSRTNDTFSAAEVKQLLTQILPVLEYIHSMGVIHRDISPENLILRRQDQLPVLIDFGCIKEVEKLASSELSQIMPNMSMSFIGTALGKLGYAPPEQLEKGIIYAHSDLYALAATAVVLLTGKEPRQLIHPDNYRWNWRSQLIPDPKFEWILNKMLSPNPSERFGSAAEVKQVLQDLEPTTASGLPATAIRTSHNQSQVHRLEKEERPRVADRRKGTRSDAVLACVLKDTPSDNRIPRSKSTIKSPLASNLLVQLLFYLLFPVILLLAGYLYLKLANLEAINSRSLQTNNSVEVDISLQDRSSQGEKVLIPQTTTPEKEIAVTAFSQGNYNSAASLLSKSLETKINDPEALIYLNNARIAQGKSYSIAVSVPIGSDVNAAEEMLRGVAQSQTEINQPGGINGLPLKVHIINDDNDPEIAKQIAQSLGQDENILGVVGHYASDVTLATAPIYEANKLVAISPISTSVELSDRSPYVFRTVPSDYLAARGLAEYMLEKLQQKKVAIFYNSQSNYSKSLQSEFRAAVYLGGGEVVNTFDLGDPNFNASDRWQQVADNGAQTIMLAASTSTLDKALQVVQVNRQRLSLLGGDDVYAPKTLGIAGEVAENMVLAIPWHSRKNPDNKFALIARKLWGGEVNWRSAMAYDATQALIAALERSPNPTRLSIQENLREPNFTTSGASSQVNFLPSGDRFTNIQLVQIQPANNRFGYGFVPIE